MSQRTVSLEQYLRDNLDTGAIDHTLRASLTPDGRVQFYIHAQLMSSDTPTFMILDNNLTVVPDLALAVS